MALKVTAALLVFVSMAAVLALPGGVAGWSSPLPRTYITTWSGPGCTSPDGVSVNANACGCNNLQLFGGYELNFRGEPVILFNLPDCRGEAATQLGAQASGCAAFGWRSVYIHCG